MQWMIDTAHTTAAFKVRHMGISNVRGSFSNVTGMVETDDAGRLVAVRATIPVDTVSTGNADRDGHLKSPDFFDAAQFPVIEFVSTSVAPAAEGYAVQGDLTLHGVTRSVTLNIEVSAPVTDPMSGKQRLGGETTLDISRKDFGLTWNAAIEAGGVMVGDKVSITLEVEAVQG